MLYRNYGNTGLKVSALGFGCMRLPMNGDEIVDELAIPMIRKAIDLGVNYIDTALGYCASKSEITVGKALKDGYREKIILSTKNPVWEADGDKWRKVLEEQLTKLDVSQIDVYHFHGINWKAYTETLSAPGGPIEASRKAQDEGLIRFRSFSFHDAPENMIKLADTGEFAGVTCQYNLLDRVNEDSIAYLKEKGMGVVIMGPVGGGRLGGPPSEELAKLIPGGAKSTPEAALRFVLANPNVSVALSGMSTMEHVLENTATASRAEPLSDAERAKIADMLEENKRLAELYCTGCNYCMPCPQNVDIPGNFRLMNYNRVFGLKEYSRSSYAELGARMDKGVSAPSWAASCLECGQCEPKCPQHIPIPEKLKEVDKTLG